MLQMKRWKSCLAKAIAKDLGIFSGNDKAMTGVELDKISDEDLKRNIFSQFLPAILHMYLSDHHPNDNPPLFHC